MNADDPRRGEIAELARLVPVPAGRELPAGRQQTLKYYFGFSQKSTDKKLVDDFNAAFRRLHKQGVIQQVLKAYKMDAVALE